MRLIQIKGLTRQLTFFRLGRFLGSCVDASFAPPPHRKALQIREGKNRIATIGDLIGSAAAEAAG
jgi:hypothetical protein